MAGGFKERRKGKGNPGPDKSFKQRCRRTGNTQRNKNKTGPMTDLDAHNGQKQTWPPQLTGTSPAKPYPYRSYDIKQKKYVESEDGEC